MAIMIILVPTVLAIIAFCGYAAAATINEIAAGAIQATRDEHDAMMSANDWKKYL